MLTFIDDFLNRITMYRLLLYVLGGLVAAAMALGAFGVIPYSAGAILYSAILAILVAWVANKVFVMVFNAAPSVESMYLTALIVVLIMPPATLSDLSTSGAIAFATLWAIASKFLITANRRHLFNPAAFGVMISGVFLGMSATWWVGGNVALLPFVAVGGLLIVRKIRRFDLVIAFGLAALAASALTGHGDILTTLSRTALHSSLFFLGFVMLTEPATMPPTRSLRVIYGIIVGVLFAPQVHIGSFYATPEIALLVGNFFAYLVIPSGRRILTLIEKRTLATDIIELTFAPDRPLAFRAGQYLEWTLPHEKSDNRGNRRYFTIASAPTEPTIKLGVKSYEPSSTFKKNLMTLALGDTVTASQLGGDFTLPREEKQKVVFIAGGIGVTPFRSMVHHMLDTGTERSAVLLYSTKTESEIAYRDIFARAERELGMKTVYVTGARMDAETIMREVPDYRERVFYISGPNGMVQAFRTTLGGMGVPRFNIKTDYFPGFA